MYIGEAFGKEEAKQQKAFVGPSGQELFHWSPLSREELVGVSNLLWYQPPKNRDPKPQEVINEWPRLMDEIEDAEPDILVTFGRIPSSYLAGMEIDLARYHGLPLDPDYGCRYHPGIDMGLLQDLQPTLMPMYHPASCLHKPDNYRWFYEDMMNLKDFLNGDLQWRLDDVTPRYELDTRTRWDSFGSDSLYSFHQEVVAVDTEGTIESPICLTYSHKPRESKLVYFS